MEEEIMGSNKGKELVGREGEDCMPTKGGKK